MIAILRGDAFLDEDALPCAHHARVLVDMPCRDVLRKHLLFAEADDFVGAFAGKALCRVVEQHVSAVAVDREYRVFRAFGDRIQQAQRLDTCRLGRRIGVREYQPLALTLREHRGRRHHQRKQSGQRDQDGVLHRFSIQLGPVHFGDQKPVAARYRPRHAQHRLAAIVFALHDTVVGDLATQHAGGRQVLRLYRQLQVQRGTAAMQQVADEQDLVAIAPEQQRLAGLGR